jgi:hypothetical protein
MLPATALAALTFGLIEGGSAGFSSMPVILTLVARRSPTYRQRSTLPIRYPYKGVVAFIAKARLSPIGGPSLYPRGRQLPTRSAFSL